MIPRINLIARIRHVITEHLYLASLPAGDHR
jgi:hypothetical protein